MSWFLIIINTLTYHAHNSDKLAGSVGGIQAAVGGSWCMLKSTSLSAPTLSSVYSVCQLQRLAIKTVHAPAWVCSRWSGACQITYACTTACGHVVAAYTPALCEHAQELAAQRIFKGFVSWIQPKRLAAPSSAWTKLHGLSLSCTIELHMQACSKSETGIIFEALIPSGIKRRS